MKILPLSWLGPKYAGGGVNNSAHKFTVVKQRPKIWVSTNRSYIAGKQLDRMVASGV